MIPVILAAALGVAAALGAEPEPNTVRYPPAEFGTRLPTGVYRNLNPTGPATVDLAAVVGKKPVVLVYWIAGNARSDLMFQQAQQAVDAIGPDRVALLGVGFEQPGRGADVFRQGIDKLGIRVPVLADDNFQLGQRLRVQSVPNITILDADGRLRLTNGASLTQVLEYKMTLENAIRRVAEKGTIGTYGYLATYYPAKELVGRACPDFTAPGVTGTEPRRWSSMLDPAKVTVLVFWSVDCPHCRASLPEFNAWLRDHREGLNVVAAAKVTDEATRLKTREFCDQQGFVFETLVDQDLKISELYQVTSTPTFVIIGPDGVVADVVTSGGLELNRTVERRKRELLKLPTS